MGLLRTCNAKVIPVTPSEYGPASNEVLLPPAPLLLFPYSRPRRASPIMLGTESAVDVENSSISMTSGFEYAITFPDSSIAGVRVRLAEHSGKGLVTNRPWRFAASISL